MKSKKTKNLGHASQDHKMKGAYLRHSKIHEKKSMRKKKEDILPSNMTHG